MVLWLVHSCLVPIDLGGPMQSGTTPSGHDK